MIPYVDKVPADPVRPIHVFVAVALTATFVGDCYYLGVLAATKWLVLAMIVVLTGCWFCVAARIVFALRGKPLRTAFGDITPKRQPKLFAAAATVGLLIFPAMGVFMVHVAHRMGIHLLR